MAVPKVTYKGQVTIPKEVRRALGLEPGDSLFQIEDGRVTLKRVKRASLVDLYGAFPATRTLPALKQCAPRLRSVLPST